jgi:hypothetical protein
LIGFIQEYIAPEGETKLVALCQLISVFMRIRVGLVRFEKRVADCVDWTLLWNWSSCLILLLVMLCVSFAAGDRSKGHLTRASTGSGKSKEE